MGLRWKLLIASLIVVLLAVIPLSILAENLLQSYYIQGMQSDLVSSAKLVGNRFATEYTKNNKKQIDNQAKEYFHETGIRFTIIDPQGIVLGDGEHNPDTMGNHANRPEIVAALRNKYGTTIRRSDTLHSMMLYVAIPVEKDKKPLCVVRVAIPMDRVEQSIIRFRQMIFWVTVFLLLIAAIISEIYTKQITEPVRKLRDQALCISKGDLDQKISRLSGDEIGDLSHVLGQMTNHLKQMLIQATEEKNKIEAIFSGMSEGILITDSAGKVTLVNPAAQTVLRLSESDMHAVSVIGVTRNHQIDGIVTKTLETCKSQQAEIRLPLPDERYLSILTAPVLDEEGNLLATITLLHDITEIRKLERVRKDFVSSASHELRTPITSIRVMAESLQAGAVDDPALRDRFINAIQESTNNLAALVDDLLTLSSLESESRKIHRDELKLSDLVQQIFPLFEHRIRQKGLELRSAIPEDLKIQGDSDLLYHALTNLLDNAVKYTNQGHISIDGSLEDGWAVIRISDTGIGIPVEHLGRIFERFYRVDKARSRALGGTGLGLSIVKHAADELGGSIEVISELGKGSTFILRLPV